MRINLTLHIKTFRIRAVLAFCAFFLSCRVSDAEVFTIGFEGTQRYYSSYEEKGMQVNSFNDSNKPVTEIAIQNNGRSGTTAQRRNARPDNGTFNISKRSTSKVSGKKSPVVIRHFENRPFALLQVDLAEYSTAAFASSSDPIMFSAVNIHGETLEQSFWLDGIIDGSGPLEDFQTFTFPASFQDLVQVAIITDRSYAMDNIVVNAIVPPSLPTPKPIPSAICSIEILFEYNILEKSLVIGDGFSFKTGYPGQIRSIKKYADGDLIALATNVFAVNFDEEKQIVSYIQDKTIKLADITTGTTSNICSLQEIQGMGYSVQSISNHHYDKDLHLFGAYSYTGNDSFHLFIRDSTCNIREVVGPEINLPDGQGRTDTAYHFPRLYALKRHSFAFDTSLSRTKRQTRLFASFNNGPIELIASEGDSVTNGTIRKFTSASFLPDDSLVYDVVDNSNRTFKISRAASGSTNAQQRFTHLDAISPTGFGSTFKTSRAESGVTSIQQTFTDLDPISPIGFGGTFETHKMLNKGDISVIYASRVTAFRPRKRESGLFTIIQGEVVKLLMEGEEFGDWNIRSVFLLGLSEKKVFVGLSPSRGGYKAFCAAITISKDYALPTNIGRGFVAKNKDRVYFPVYNLTGKNNYLIQKSSDLIEWTTMTKWTNYADGSAKYFYDSNFTNENSCYYRLLEINNANTVIDSD